MQLSNEVANRWLLARDTIAKFLAELCPGMSAEHREHNAAAVIARLSHAGLLLTRFEDASAEEAERDRLRGVINDAYVNLCGALFWAYDPNADASGNLPRAVAALVEVNAELGAALGEYKAMKFAYEKTPKQWSTAQAPTLESIVQTARLFALEAENEKLRKAVEGFREAFAKIMCNCDSAFAGDSYRGPKPFVDLIHDIARDAKFKAVALLAKVAK